MEKTCSACGESKPLTAFNWDSTKAQRRKSRCRLCVSEYHKKWYTRLISSAEGKERVRRYARSTKPKTQTAAQKERAREYARTYRKQRRLSQRFDILQRFSFTCQYCGRKAPEVQLHIDHIVPDSKGGSSDRSNLTVACADCNIGKSDKLLNS